MTTKAHQLAARVASAEWLTARHPPMTPEQQALADEWARAWETAQQGDYVRMELKVTMEPPSSKAPPQP
jgi:hypothetical protein